MAANGLDWKSSLAEGEVGTRRLLLTDALEKQQELAAIAGPIE